MSQHAREQGFVALASLPVVVPVLVFLSLSLAVWGLPVAWGFALGAGSGLMSSYFSLQHLRRLLQRPPGGGRIRRGAFSGTLASLALMGVFLAVSALSPYFEFLATAAGLLATKWLLALTLSRKDTTC